MKTILINRTLTTIALLSTIQCGYGTATVSTLKNLLNNYSSKDDSTESGYTYTLGKGTYTKYKLSFTSDQSSTNVTSENITLIIPENFEFEVYSEITKSNEGLTGCWLKLYNSVTIKNYGVFKNNALQGYYRNGFIENYGNLDNEGVIFTQIANASLTFSGGGDIINSGYVVARGENSSIEFSGGGDITNSGNCEIYTYGENSSITFSGGGNITNNENGKICTSFNASNSRIIFSGSGDITNSDGGDIYSNSSGSSITFSGDGNINNSAAIDAWAENSSVIFSGTGAITNAGEIYAQKSGAMLMFSGGSVDTPQIVTTSGTSSKSGEIYLGKANSSMTIVQYSILSFGDYGKFYSNESNGNVTLNGTISIASINASVDTTNMDISGDGTIDMSPLRPYSSTATDVNQFDNHDFFTCSSSQRLPNIKLPFNCKFVTGLNLRHAASVSYTVLKKGNTAKIVWGTIRLGDYITDEDVTETYGDYATQSLGVTLPKTNGVIDTSKIHITNEYAGSMSLSYLALKKDENNDLKYNKSDYQLDTNDLTDATDTIESNATSTYNFWFTGTTPIKISGEGKAVFNGINSNYTPKDEYDNPVEIRLPNNVEFGANESLFRFTETYGHGTFRAGNYINVIPSGKTVTFTNGFTLGKGHTLIVCGTLIG